MEDLDCEDYRDSRFPQRYGDKCHSVAAGLEYVQHVPYIKQYRENVLSSEQMGYYRRRLLDVITTSESDRKEHLGNVYRNKERRDEAVVSGKCPRCGGNLVLRNGKYGQFYGCFNYPKYNYILNK